MKANYHFKSPKRTSEAHYPENYAISKYKDILLDMLRYNFPLLSSHELAMAIDWSISKRYKNTNIEIYNNYKNKRVSSTILDVIDYIADRKPILTSYGVMFSRHGDVPNPIIKMLEKFAESRKAEKKLMFQHPKGSEEFEKHNLLQLLHKLDSNAYYGASGRYSCIYYNLHVAASVTREGKNCNSAAALFFESFLNNNVPFASMNELIEFIHNVLNEQYTYNISEIITNHPNVTDVFFRLMSTTGFGWIPNEDEMFTVWEIVTKLNQDQLDKLYYKNNLFEFIENAEIKRAIVFMLQSLNAPYMNPYEPPEEIKVYLDEFTSVIYEFVYYKFQIINRVEKMQSLVRSVSIIQDTDSAIISLDGWFQKVRQFCIGVPMAIKNMNIDGTTLVETGEVKPTETKQILDELSFIDDDIIDSDRSIDPMQVIPQDGLRYSIINILANTITTLIDDYMSRYCDNNNSNQEGKKCLISMKNEFLFKRVLLTNGKKMYASIIELQEGNLVPKESSLDIKGIPALAKSTSNPTIQKRLKDIMYDDILNAPTIDQIKVLKDLAKVEQEIFDSINNGEKTFYKPLVVKSVSAYEHPMSIQGITASYAYNQLHEPDTETLDLNSRNSVDVAKVDINKKNIERIKDKYPGVYERAVRLLQTPEYAGGITSIAIPVNEPVPGWVLEFINFSEIIKNNVAGFPIESIGLYRGCDDNNTMNIIKF